MFNRFLKNFTKFTGKHLCLTLFLIKLQPSDLQVFKKETPTQVFSREFCEIFRDTIFTEHLRTTASEIRRVSFVRISFFSLDKPVLANTIPRIFEGGKILLHLLKQRGLCSVVHLQ